MIFKIHYVLFNAGLSAITIMLTVFLRRYSDASPSEIGTLLMILPFVSVIAKPLFCAIADRHRAHKATFVCCLITLLIGYGSFVILPYFPDFVRDHGRSAWYIFIVLVVIGYTAFGVVWSLGDAFAVNMCRRRSQSFGMYRLWGTMSWGVFGLAIGQVNQGIEGWMPEYTPAFFVMIVAVAIEIVIVMLWPRKQDFVLGDLASSCESIVKQVDEHKNGQASTMHEHDNGDTNGSQFEKNIKRLMSRTASIVEDMPSGHVPGNMADSLRLSTFKSRRILNMSDVNGSLTSSVVTRSALDSLRFGSHSKRPTIRTTQSTESNSIKRQGTVGSTEKKLARQDAVQVTNCGDPKEATNNQEYETSTTNQGQQDLQWAIFKMIASRDKLFLKYFILFIAFGALFNIHISFFLLHLEQLTEHLGIFNHLVGLCLMMQAIAETIVFMIVPSIINCLGRAGSTCLCLILFGVRYLYYGLALKSMSPYTVLLTEPIHGINYGIAYYLVTDIALYMALKADDLVPELIERKIIDKNFDKSIIQSSVRATMQGVFSGAFDGFGCGSGALIAGFVLEHYSFESLWCLCGVVSLILGVGYGAGEMLFAWLQRRKTNDSFSAFDSMTSAKC